MTFENILTKTEGPVGIVQLNRPKVLNALNEPTMRELNDALEEFERDDAIRVMIITGNDRAFAAGADIKEMSEATPVEMLRINRIAQWDRLKKITAGTTPGKATNIVEGEPERVAAEFVKCVSMAGK